MGDLEAKILRLLQSTNARLTRSQISTSISQSSLDTIKALRSLQEAQLVRESNGRWKAIAYAPPSRPMVLGSRANRMNSTRAEYRGESERLPVIDEKSRWLGFRRLCAYYADCVRMEERPKIVAYTKAARQQFLEVSGPLDWRALAAGNASPFSASAEDGDVLQRISQREGPKIFYLGCPVDVFRGTGSGGESDSYTALSPIFLQRVILQVAQGTTWLVPTGRIEINHGWLIKRFRSFQTRSDFLNAIGLDIGSDDDDEENELLLVGSFVDAVRRLYGYVNKDFMEYPDLQKRVFTPGLHETTRSGIYNRAILVAEPRLQYGARLFRELQELAFHANDEDLDRSALAAIFPHGSPPKSASSQRTSSDTQDHKTQIYEYQVLSDDQIDACRSALKNKLTLVTGPPGTGKSVTAAHLLLNAVIAGEKAVFASRNHQALQAVEPRLNALCDPEILMIRPFRKHDDQSGRFEWAQAISELLSKPIPQGATVRLENSKAELAKVSGELAVIENEIENTAEIRQRISNTRSMLAQLSKQPAEFWQVIAEDGLRQHNDASLAHVHKWDQLISNPTAGLAERFRAYVIKLLHGSTVTRLRSEAEKYLRSSRICTDADLLDPIGGLIQARVMIKLARELDSLELQARQLRAQTELNASLENTQEQQRSALSAVLQARAAIAGTELTAEERQKFAGLRAALKNRGPTALLDDAKLAREFDEQIRTLFDHYPLWAVTNLSVSKVAPLAPAIFDLAVLDESSQCDIPSILPILFRAERAVIVGDPNQLSHVTQISRDSEMLLREHHKVSSLDFERFTFAANSAYDLAAGAATGQKVTLTDHYRCSPSIVAYCNNEFYSKALRVRTSRSSTYPRSCLWTHIKDDSRPATTGCISDAQVESVVAEVKRLVRSPTGATIGVVTPFRTQADRIRDAAYSRIPIQELQKHEFLVATADGFQGDERDIILFSLVGGPSATQGAMTFLATDRNRFNVAVSRARHVLHVYGDSEWAAKTPIPHIRKLYHHIDSASNEPAQAVRWDLVGPVWEPKLARALDAHGIEYVQQYPTAGFYLDFAVFSGDRKLNIEVDGETYHRDSSGMRRIDDIYRDHVLIASGWDVMRFWVYELRENFDECVGRIRQTLEQ